MSEERSPEEIVRYYEKIQQGDKWGIWGTELLIRVPLKDASRFLRRGNGWTEEAWSKAMKKRDSEYLVGEMEDFIQDAIERSLLHNHVIAFQSIDYYRAWSWLMRDMDLFEYLIEEKNYPNFGAPMLFAVMQQHDFLELLPEHPDDRIFFQNMAQGLKCNNLCIKCGGGNPKFFNRNIILPPNGEVLRDAL